jgi:hypothetical protein
LALLGVIGVATEGCVVDTAGGDTPGGDNGAITGDPGGTVIKPVADAERFPAPLPESGDTDKACSYRSDYQESFFLDWGPFPASGNMGWASCPHFCPEGSFAYSIQLRTERNQHSGDDTALNSIYMDCYHRYPDINGNAVYTGTITSQTGWWGDLGTRPVCPTLLVPITRGQTTFLEGKQYDGDDTALNAVVAKCAPPSNTDADVARNAGTTTLEPSHQTSWGVSVAEEGTFSSSGRVGCPQGTAVCGIKTQLEPKQGSSDDTALNGAAFYCCTF